VLAQPGCQEALDLARAARTHEPGAHRLVLDDDERGKLVYPEALDQAGVPGLVHAVNREGVVVAWLRQLR
jgi:hypothetical protein